MNGSLGQQYLGLPTVRKTSLAQQLNGSSVECLVCERRCKIARGGKGFCKTKMNIDGVLHTLVYGDISSISANPIEKKPFFHFYPGSQALTVGTYGCNFLCPWCQNWEISKSEPDPPRASYLSPQDFVRMAVQEGCQGSSISFNEPTLLFEYALDLFPLCREMGLYNTFVSNGYMTLPALESLKEAGLDAIKFDVKGDKESVREPRDWVYM